MSPNKGNQTLLKFGQLTEYISGEIFFFKNHVENDSPQLDMQ